MSLFMYVLLLLSCIKHAIIIGIVKNLAFFYYEKYQIE